MTPSSGFATAAGFSLEYAWIDGRADPSQAAPLMVFLHEGLGSLALWKDFPAQLCAALGMRGLVYSRPGYGRSTPRRPDEQWPVDFMHRQAIEVLPALLSALGIDTRAEPPWLFGHSDGASIALIHAGRFPGQVAGTIAVAPHVFVEDISIASIERACLAYREHGLRERLARWHDDVDSAFGGWSQAWLSPAFRDWNLLGELTGIRQPVLAIQGEDDEYGTMAQLAAIARAVPGTDVLALEDCGHSPHRDQSRAVIDAVRHFVIRTGGHGMPGAPSASDNPANPTETP